MADAGVSIEMPTGKVKDLSPPSTAHKPRYFGPPSEERLNIRNASRSRVSSTLGALRL